jgi:hypothetical protein
MSEGTSKDKLKSSDFKFTPVKGWLGGDATEKIEGWNTRLYEATGKMKMVNIDKVGPSSVAAYGMPRMSLRGLHVLHGNGRAVTSPAATQSGRVWVQGLL